jgi:beta-N-acetylhexosaminidase
MTQKTVIIDLDGLEVSQEEKELLKHPCVAGVLLFARNYDSIDQLKALSKSIQELNPGLIVSVDQEGGRIQRFRKDFTALPSMQYWGNFYQEEPLEAEDDLKDTIKTMVGELLSCGVNLSIAPVLDLDHGVSDVISDRSFSNDPEVVSELGNIFVETMRAMGMKSVAKHFPGHGGVKHDTHHEVAVDERSRKEVWSCDLLPFKRLASAYDSLMPAHIIYPQIKDEVVTFSQYWLQEVLRKELKFEGVIISDDLTMFAASQLGDYSIRAEAALTAGCDLLIAANNRSGVIDILTVADKWTQGRVNPRLEKFLKSFETQVSML